MPIEPATKIEKIDPKNVELLVAEKQRMVIMQVTNMKTGKVESLVAFQPEELVHHLRNVMTAARQINAHGAGLVLPGDINFKELN